MLITSTDHVPGKKILEIKDMVFSEQVISINVAKDIMNGIKGFFGAKIDAYSEEYTKVRTLAIDDLTEQAKALNGDAIVHLNVFYNQFINSDIMFVTVTAYGTVVRLESL